MEAIREELELQRSTTKGINRIKFPNSTRDRIQVPEMRKRIWNEWVEVIPTAEEGSSMPQLINQEQNKMLHRFYRDIWLLYLKDNNQNAVSIFQQCFFQTRSIKKSELSIFINHLPVHLNAKCKKMHATFIRVIHCNRQRQQK